MPSRFSARRRRIASRWPVATAALAGLVLLTGCGDESNLSDDSVLRVYVSLPTRGESGANGRDAADGARLALAEAGGEAGGVRVEAEFLDDTEGPDEAARWSPVRAAANARRAAQDSTAIAYLGDFESGATRASLPITNEARMLQVSPASSAVDLVAPEVGSEEVPKAQPTGERTFGRVIPADDIQGAAALEWATQLRVDRVAIRSDHTPFARALVDGFELFSRGAVDISHRNADLTYLAGRPPPRGGLEIGSDAYLLPPGQQAPAMITSAARDPSQLPPKGKELLERFRDEYGRDPGRYAAYGYEAMAVILDSIERADDPADRTAVIEAFFDTADRSSAVGTYSIDELGNATLGGPITGYEVRRGRLTAARELLTEAKLLAP